MLRPTLEKRRERAIGLGHYSLAGADCEYGQFLHQGRIPKNLHNFNFQPPEAYPRGRFRG